VIITPLGILGTLFSVLTLNPIVMLSMLGSTIVMVISGILLFMAFNPLRERSHRGWMLLFWSDMLSVATFVLTLVSNGGWLGSVIGMIIGFYLLFQIRPAYNPAVEVIAKTTKK
jgi:hypothetical protein